jgi:hypothetical protein
MSAKQSLGEDDGRKGAGLLNRLIATDGRRCSRGALLAGASLIALAALGGSDSAQACVPSLQTISAPTVGPVLSNDGAIVVTSTGVINGGPDGVDAPTCSISTLSNSGTVGGATGGAGAAGGRGVAVSSGQTITTLTNDGTIKGGVGGSAGISDPIGGAGGTGVSSGGNITTLTNNAMIAGGAGGGGATSGAAGGAGISASAAMGSLINTGTIAGGIGGSAFSHPGAGGAGLFNKVRSRRCPTAERSMAAWEATFPQRFPLALRAGPACRTPQARRSTC